MVLKPLLYILALTVAFIYTTTIDASDFVKFEASRYRVAIELPTLDTLIQMDNNGTPSVHLYYPEYAALSREETRLIKKSKQPISDKPLIQIEHGTAQRLPLVNVRITPFIKRKNTYYRLLSTKLVVSSDTTTHATSKEQLQTQRTTMAAKRYKPTSVLANGKWIKIRVPHSGIFQLTPSLLSRLGISSLNRVRIFGYGGKLQHSTINYTVAPRDIDDLEEVPVYNTGDKILFYAQGPLSWSPWTYSAEHTRYVSTRTINPYASHGYYFITEGTPMSFPEVAVTTTPTQTLTTFPERALYEQDAFAWLQSGSQLYDPYDFASGASKTFNIATPDAVASRSLIKLSHTVAHKTSTQTAVSLNGKQLGRFTIPQLYDEYYLAQVGNATYTTDETLPNTSRISLTMPIGTSAHLDYITINYDRQLALNTHTNLLFSHYTTTPAEFQISGATPQTQVWRIGQGSGNTTTRLNTTLTGNTLRVTVDNPAQEYVAFNTSTTFPTPEVIGAIANQNLHADEAIDMVIIVPESAWLLPQAERLADHHRTKDKLRVRIVRADQLYNEFSSGTPDAMAYRRYLKMLYDRAESKADMPKFLLLFGASLWDNRFLTNTARGLSPKDYLLCYESDNSTHKVISYVSDDFFGFLDDGEGDMRTSKLDLAIGRISPRTLEEATTAVDKIIAYANNTHTGAWKNRITMMADDGDYNRHMSDAEIVSNEIEARDASYIVDKVFWDAYKIQNTATGNRYPDITAHLRTAMQNGSLIMNYTGHGSPTLVSHEQVLNIRDFRINSHGHFPYWAFAACEVTPFDGTADYISAAALFNKQGGAVAVYGASRDVYASQNFALNRQMMRHLLAKDSLGQTPAMGEAMRLAKNAMPAEDNKLKYIFYGDPALRLAVPQERIVIDSVNGTTISDTILQLKAGSTLTLSGHVASYADSTPIRNFTGSITASLYDRLRTLTGQKNNSSSTTSFIFQARKDLLFTGSDSVRSGRFTLTIPIPMDISYSNDLGKLFLYAVSNNSTTEAHGSWNSFYLNGTIETLVNDSAGPNVTLYLNNPKFIDGGYTGTTPQLVAEINDKDGINTTGLGIGHDIELIIDNDATKTYILNDHFTYTFGSYTTGQVRFSLPELSAGKHQLRFRVWDLKNNATTHHLNFIVDASAEANTTLTLSANPATTSTEMLVRYPATAAISTVTIQVFDIMGRLCMEQTATGLAGTNMYTHTWHLTTSNGQALPSGIYLCRAAVTSPKGTQYTQTQKLIISRP
ncbi:MAG: type IX secretion system sortase PorU [Bacteroidales bacterium]|nr:type IX secretion system sortase PorU [Bacteroidales bacterium]